MYLDDHDHEDERVRVSFQNKEREREKKGVQTVDQCGQRGWKSFGS